jgi:hypothetical protein
MTPSVIESHERSKRFHAEIARRAALVPQREERRSFEIPNTPFGIPKWRQPDRFYTINPEPYWRQMWFYDLVFTPPINTRTERVVTVLDVRDATAAHFGLTLAELVSERRDHKVVRPRQIAMHLAKKLTSRSLPEIGRRFGGRDHTTVLHAVKLIERLQVENAQIGADVEAIRKKVLG